MEAIEMTLYIVGSINMDLSIQTERMPKKGETRLGSQFLLTPGGKGANQAVAVKKSGGNAVMVGCVGKEFGPQLKDSLSGYGVDTTYLQTISDHSSGIAFIIVEKTDNRIIVDPGANHLISKTLIDDALAGARPGDYLLTQLEIPVEVVMYALAIAKKKQMKTFLNPAPATKLPDQIIPLIDYFLPNQSEAAFYTGIHPENESSVRSCAKSLLTKGMKNVLITLGESGSWLFGEQEIRIGIYPVKVVDTTAAGDTYIGAFSAKLALGWPAEQAMDYAAKAASITLSRRGAQQSIPAEAEVMRLG